MTHKRCKKTGKKADIAVSSFVSDDRQYWYEENGIRYYLVAPSMEATLRCALLRDPTKLELYLDGEEDNDQDLLEYLLEKPKPIIRML